MRKIHILFTLIGIALSPCFADNYKVEVVNSVPQITANGKPICSKMVYAVYGGTIGVKADTSWRTFTEEFTSTFDCPKCAIHVRFLGLDATDLYFSEVKIENLTTGKTEKVFDFSGEALDKDITFWCKDKNRKDLPLVLKNAKVDGKNVFCCLVGERKPKEMEGFHVIMNGIGVKANNVYKMSVSLKTNRPVKVNMGLRKQFDDYRLIKAFGVNCITAQVAMAKNAGVDFATFPIYTPWANDGGDFDLTEYKAAFDEIIAANPNARVIPRLLLYPSEKWRESHPDDMVTYFEYNKLVVGKKYVSLSSENYRKDGVETIKRIIEFTEKNYPNNIAGYHITNGRNQEWFYGDTWSGRNDGFDIATQKEWRKFLKNKYKDDKAYALSRKDASAKMETATVPSVQRRLSAKDYILNPQKDQDLIDYNEFMQVALCDTLETFCNAAKESAPNRLVLAFYGYSMELSNSPKGPASSGHYALERILKNKNIDILCGPISYCDRRFGDGKTVMGAAESITAAGKLWLDEDDTSTYLAPKEGNYPGIEPTLLTQKDTISVLRRNLAQEYVRNFANWFMDLGGEGWFADQKLFDQIKLAQSATEGNLAVYNPQTAFICDEASMVYVGLNTASHRTTSKTLRYGRGELNKCAIPFGHYLLSDVLLNKVNAQMKIFAATIAMDAAQRANLAKICKDSFNVWVWLPAYIDKSANAFSIEAVEELTGFEVEEVKMSGKLIATKEGLKAGLPQTFGEGATLPMLAPVAEDGDIVLAKFQNGAPAVVVRKNNMFVPTTFVPWQLYLHAAKLAKIHIYCQPNTAVYASEKYISITAQNDGMRNVNLNGTFNVYDIFNQKDLGQKSVLDLDMKRGDNLFFKLSK